MVDECMIFFDVLNYVLLIDGVRLLCVFIKVYLYVDFVVLEVLLVVSMSCNKLIVMDGVFSMDGDIVLLFELFVLVECYDVWLIVDDVYGLGVFGEKGVGVLLYFGLCLKCFVYVGIFGKVVGGLGVVIVVY